MMVVEDPKAVQACPIPSRGVNPRLQRVVDLFAQHSIEFDMLWSRAEAVALESTSVRVAAIDDLIQLKRLAGRPQDLTDIDSSGFAAVGRSTTVSDRRTAGASSWANWKVTWTENRDLLLDATPAATPAQRLAWLEEVLSLAYRAGALDNVVTEEARADGNKPSRDSAKAPR